MLCTLAEPETDSLSSFVVLFNGSTFLSLVLFETSYETSTNNQDLTLNKEDTTAYAAFMFYRNYLISYYLNCNYKYVTSNKCFV